MRRPPDPARRVLAADVGGTWVRAALVDGRGGVLDRRRAATPMDPDAGLAVVEALWNDLGPGDGRAIAVAGGIAAATGEVTQSSHLPSWVGLRPGERLHCPVVNDAKAALLGEAWRGALQRRRSALLVTLGTGIGGALMLGGRLWIGHTGTAGEIGHVTVRPGGLECRCGNLGCLVMYAGAAAIAREAGHADGHAAATAARGGDERSRGAFEQAAAALGIALAATANVINPEVICVAGGLAPAFDLLEQRLWREVRGRAFRQAVEGLAMVPAALGDDAGLLGAAWTALGRDDVRDPGAPAPGPAA
jgi:glucokinase